MPVSVCICMHVCISGEKGGVRNVAVASTTEHT